MMGKVQILLSTYNGEQYIEQQLDSILNQTYKNISVLIRDDGSEDNTLIIIKSYIRKYPGIFSLIEARNVGVINSFFELILNTDENAEYFCFCDQDDSWLSHKIEYAVKELSVTNPTVPALHFTSTFPTNDMYRTEKIWPRLRKKPTFYNALIENVAVGATITFNRSAKELIKYKMPNSSNIIMHDWWLYLVVSSLGVIIYNKEPSILYRQHKSNLIGADVSWVKKYKKKWYRFKSNKNKHFLYHQAYEFQKIYKDLLEDNERRELDLFLLPREKLNSKLYFLKHTKLYRQSCSENLLFKFLVILGYI
ncbi:glycosyltransferase family 2 protein [Paenibacillus sp. URB8-2]|uniref:glycosyltransferase family 2 protein n=1 Tax=Paenibacillus sp. URB8-2 TaxID=2741301 RepID=UPI0015C1E1CD|nr:glycosyltransferase family 2 protein [Paenibacillus sp. URB8-2]BCG61260.1 hypothetical protein PUR_46850 [Paenibacillus sp. URB8-2]